LGRLTAIDDATRIRALKIFDQDENSQVCSPKRSDAYDTTVDELGDSIERVEFDAVFLSISTQSGV
jgi:hypothetical protein